MNTAKVCAKYVGEGTTEHGIRFTEVTVSAVGKGEDIKLRVLSTKAGGDTLGSCSKGANLIIVGRLYRNRAVQSDYNYYVVPTQRIEVVPCPVPLNTVTIAGAYWLNDNDKKLNHEYDDTLSFSITSWSYDAQRILQTAHIGRQMIIEGYLRSYTPAGKDTGYISINVRSGIVEMFGSKEKKKENKIDNKSDSASKVVIQGETKAEELPI